MREQRSKEKSDSRRIAVLSSEKGAALLMTLMLAAISLAFTSALMLMVTTRTQDGSPRYLSACEAVKTGADIFLQAVNERGRPAVANSATLSPSFTYPAGVASPISGLDCFEAKLGNDSALWQSGCSDSEIIDTTSATSYDMSFDLGSSPIFGIYAKISDTFMGNTASGTGAGGAKLMNDIGVVHSFMSLVSSPPLPYLYAIEVLAKAKTGTGEECRMSMLYQF